MVIDDDAKSIITWVKNTGVKPDYKRVLYKVYKSGVIRAGEVKDLQWDIGYSNASVEYYAIIE